MAITHTAFVGTPGFMRTLNILSDLPAVADLIELCFSSTLDSSGQSFLEQMRRSARDSRFLQWAPRMIDSISLPLSGFVWEDEGRIVGNVSLIPFHKWERRTYLIANVATHPDYRRRGIGQLLTEAAMKRARERGCHAIWLHVRHDNPGAISIYRKLGFSERTRRTQWTAHSGAGLPQVPQEESFEIRSRISRDWDSQQKWFEHAYPAALDWYHQQSWKSFGPQLWNGFYRLLADVELSQWSVLRAGELRGILTVQRSIGHLNHAWAAFPAKPDLDAIIHLLLYARRSFHQTRGISLEYPAGPADEAIRAAGFIPYRTLLWMEAAGTI
jgi:ribosomal protein S18 acetylase RimI-like enzyme